MTALCATHPEHPASVTCKRCGVFMCERCAEFGVEDRCQACRPKRGAQERRERRDNAVKRAAFCRCEACGYLGPRFDRFIAPTLSERLVILLLPLFLSVVGLIVGFLIAVRGWTKPSCPGCGRNDTLWPATNGARESEPVYLQAVAAQDADWFTPRREGLITAAVTLAVYGLMAVGLFALIFLRS